MFAGSGVTKLDLALYYARVGDWLLPELLRRPVTVIRCPTGDLKDCFYQRHAFAGLPPGVETIELADEEERAAFITITEPKGYLGAGPVRRDRVPPLGLPRRRPGASRTAWSSTSIRTRACPGRGSATAPRCCATGWRRWGSRPSCAPPAARGCTW